MDGHKQRAINRPPLSSTSIVDLKMFQAPHAHEAPGQCEEKGDCLPLAGGEGDGGRCFLASEAVHPPHKVAGVRTPLPLPGNRCSSHPTAAATQLMQESRRLALRIIRLPAKKGSQQPQSTKIPQACPADR